MEMEETKMEIFTNSTKDYPRSNARSRYRRSEGRSGEARGGSYARKNTPENEKAPASFKERTVLQATICGGFLAVLLFFNIIDSGFTNGVTDWIDRNISYDMLAEEGGVGGWVASVLGIFGNDEEAEAQLYYEATHEDAPVVPMQRIEPPAGVNTVDSSRVDENILNEIEAMGRP